MSIQSQALLFLLCLPAVVGAFAPPPSHSSAVWGATKNYLTQLHSTQVEPAAEAETTESTTTTRVVVKESNIPSAAAEIDRQAGQTPQNGGAVESDIGAPPGLVENDKFVCDENVKFWRDFQRDGFESAEANARALASVASNFASLGPDGISYWLRHAGRSAYFATNAVLGNVGYQLHERLVNGRETTFTGALPFNMDGSIASRLVLEAALSYEQDYEEIRRGSYREPWDMEPNHRQSSPLNVVTQTSRFVSEAIGTLGRRSRSSQKDRDIWISDGATPSLYPDYYQTAFHYQTDGWMSKRSADVYETSTETLFLGRQDAMQRTSLKPLVALSEKLREGDGTLDRPMRVLEVACGTGRFMTFVRDNLPLDTEYTAVDLSPFYLDAARDNDNYWRKTRRSQERQNGSRGGEVTADISPARLVQAQAESLPFADGSFDAVVCVYLFHELPRSVRGRAAAEMARVVTPGGGTVVLTDSIQRGDRPVLDDGLDNFENMNEPYYADYCRDDLPAHFERVGLRPATKSVRSTSKSLCFTKP